ncbi:MAG: hypothetical protein ABI594_21930 [Ginsengibacter sp.]
MADEEQTPPVQVPDETNNYTHIDTPSSKGKGDDNTGHHDETKGGQSKDKTGKGESDFSSDIMQTEIDIDPGNEHHHQLDDDVKSPPAPDADDDELGTAGS